MYMCIYAGKYICVFTYTTECICVYVYILVKYVYRYIDIYSVALVQVK